MSKILSALAIAAFSGTAVSQGFIPASPNCAILYGNENFQQNEFPDPGVYVIKDDENQAKLEGETWGNFENKTSAATVRAGCKLTLYASRNFTGLPLQVIEGPKAVTIKNGSLLHNDAARSAKCECPVVFAPPTIGTGGPLGGPLIYVVPVGVRP